MESGDYTLSELADIAGTTPRTIRYYVANGLLPSPGYGPGARYTKRHVNRLYLIRKLQRAHMPLAEIRSRIAALDDEDIRGLVEQPTEAPSGTALDYVREVLGNPASSLIPRAALVAPAPKAGPVPQIGPVPAPAAGPQVVPDPPDEPEPLPVSVARAAEPDPAFNALETPGSDPPIPRSPDRSQWDRISLTNDVELHVRRPLDRLTNRRLERLVALARQLLQEDQQ
jgi:DNA-binding transcriptional MerR regulator